MATLTNKIESFGLKDNKRRYVVVTLDFQNAKKLFSADRYRAETGQGEQRELVMAHVKALRKEMEDGNYTPTSVTVGLRSEQEGVVLKFLDLKSDESPHAEISLADGATLPLLDGGHRFSAMEYLWEQEAYKEDIGKSSVTALVLLDGNTKKDFLNLQKGRPVDKSHIHSLSVQEKLLKEKDANVLTIAYNAAKLLNTNEKSPFHKQIRFDSAGVSGIPIASLSSKGASDIATSLVGGAKIAVLAGKDAEWLANQIVTAYTYLKDGGGKDLLERGMKLTPPPEGTKGSATMLIAMGNMLAARLALKGNNSPDNDDVKLLVEAAKKTLGGPVNGNFSGPMKRNAIGDFAEKFFADLLTEETNHFGVPKKLVETLSTSTFSVPKVEKEKSKPGRKPKAKKEDNDKTPEDDTNVFDEKPEEVAPPTKPAAPAANITEKAPWEDDESQG